MNNKKLSEKIINILEYNGFAVGEVEEQDGKCIVDIAQSTPEGEDWYENIWFDGTDEDFIHEVRQRADSFDVNEEAETYINMRGQNGVPNSISDLIEDAKWKWAALQDLVSLLESGIPEQSQKENMIASVVEYAEELKQITNSLVEDVSDSESMTEAWNKIDRYYQTVETMRNRQKATSSKSFNGAENNVDGHTRYLQGMDLPIMVHGCNATGQPSPCYMKVETVDDKLSLLITPTLIVK